MFVIMCFVQGSGFDLLQDDVVVGYIVDVFDFVEVGEIDLVYGLGGIYFDGLIFS